MKWWRRKPLPDETARLNRRDILSARRSLPGQPIEVVWSFGGRTYVAEIADQQALSLGLNLIELGVSNFRYGSGSRGTS